MRPKMRKVTKGDNEYWEFAIGKRWGGTGQKEYADTRSDAKSKIDKAIAAKNLLGEAAKLLTPDAWADATVAISKLKPLGVTLTTSAEFYVKHHPDGQESPTLKNFAAETLRARGLSCGKHTLSSYRSELKHVLAEFGEVPLSEIYQAEIEDFASELDLAPRTICNVLDTFTMVLNSAIAKGLLIRNPAAFVPRPAPTGDPIGILTPIQAAKLICAAQENMPRLVRPVTACLFAGLRRAETCRVTDASLILEEDLLDVPVRASKTRQRRLITILPNFRQWIDDTSSFPEPLSGTVSPDVFGAWLHELAIAAGITNWPHNAMRHSFGSFLWAATQNETLVAAQMGNSPGVVIRHYRAIVRPNAANLYFSIVPSNVRAIAAGKVPQLVLKA